MRQASKISISEIESCELALLSEFGEECRGRRSWFAQKITDYFKNVGRPRFRCFPTNSKTRVKAYKGTTGKILIGRHDRTSWEKHIYPYATVKVTERCGELQFA